MEQALFDELPAQAVPERPDCGVARLRVPERRQVASRAVSLDELVAGDHRVRLVWRFVEGLDLSPLYAGIEAVAGRPGHPPAERGCWWRCGCTRRWRGSAAPARWPGRARSTWRSSGCAAGSA